MKKLIYLFVAGLVGFLIYLIGLLIYPNWDNITGVTHGFLDCIREMRGIKLEPFDTTNIQHLADAMRDATTASERFAAAQKLDAAVAKASNQFTWAALGCGLFRIAREKFHAYLLIALLGVIFAFVYAKALSIRSRNRGHEKAK